MLRPQGRGPGQRRAPLGPRLEVKLPLGDLLEAYLSLFLCLQNGDSDSYQSGLFAKYELLTLATALLTPEVQCQGQGQTHSGLGSLPRARCPQGCPAACPLATRVPMR